MIGAFDQWVHNAVWLRALATKAMRFGLVGIVSAGIYAGVTVLCVSRLGLEAKVASTIGYLAALPLSFVAHRQYTFVAGGIVWREAIRFIAVHIANIGISIGTMALAVDGFDLGYGFGVAGALVLVPLVAFILMNFWVFQKQKV